MNQEQVLLMAKKWNTIYPAYFDSTKSKDQGKNNKNNDNRLKKSFKKFTSILK